MRSKNSVWISVVMPTEARDHINAAVAATGMKRNAWIKQVLAEAADKELAKR